MNVIQTIQTKAPYCLSSTIDDDLTLRYFLLPAKELPHLTRSTVVIYSAVKGPLRLPGYLSIQLRNTVVNMFWGSRFLHKYDRIVRC